MVISHAMNSTIVPIQGTYDIAMARNTLRTKIGQQGWPSVMNARASAALTALGEVILALNLHKPVLVKIELTDEVRKGICLISQLVICDKDAIRWDERKTNLSKVASSEIVEHGDNVQIRLSVWNG